MARSYAQIHQRIWADPDWRALNIDAQHLYLLLISQPSINLAGVLPMQLRRWASCVSGWQTSQVEGALEALTAARFVVVDEDTEEVLVRSLIRNDGAYKTPGMLKSILKFAEATQSPMLRATLGHELGRLPALEGKTAADGMKAIAATRAALGSFGGPSGPGGEPIPDGIGDGIGDAILGTHRGYVPEPIGDTSVTVTGSVPSLSLVRSLGEGSSPAPSDEAPPCKTHAGWNPEDIPPCRGCGRARQRWEEQRQQVESLIAAEAAKPKPMCPDHPGQLAAFCGPCRSERLARGTA